MSAERFEVLDSFRGIAALCVMFFHIHVVSGISEMQFFRNSGVFVEFFFLLSGFVIMHAYGERVASMILIKKYIKSRVKRIFPLHLFMLVVFLCLEFLKLFAYRYYDISFNNAPFSGGNSIREIIPNALLLQSWIPTFDMLSFNSPSWSISAEFYVYLLFVLFVLLAGNNAWFSTLLFFVLYNIPYLFDDVSAGVVRGAGCFFMGVALRQAYPYFKNKIFGSISSLEALVVEVVLFLFAVVSVLLLGEGVVCVMTFSLVILFFSLEMGVLSKILKNNVFQSVGRWSYSIYLTHSAVIFVFLSGLLVVGKVVDYEFLSMVSDKRNVNMGYWLNNIYLLVVTLTTLFVSSFTYKHVELRFMR